jgi:NlpC/P60 family
MIEILNEDLRYSESKGYLDPGKRIVVPPLPRILAFEFAAKNLSKKDWATWNSKGILDEGENKCNLFVSDVYDAAGALYPRHSYTRTQWVFFIPIDHTITTKFPALSSTMADTSRKRVGDFEIVDASSARIGDVVAVKIPNLNDASGHSMIYAGNIKLLKDGVDLRVTNKMESEKGPYFIGVNTSSGKVLVRSAEFLNTVDSGKYKNRVYRRYVGVD